MVVTKIRHQGENLLGAFIMSTGGEGSVKNVYSI